ncbi:Predicted flavoprotein CzcO associated with the cation diffusion facilitator CzcD [Kytococcus aerolatus]|uniref:Predicted flavoprotein CzcO associated with the cation diffusion facilitator CzcD n=1 Tax=Kytococcus aerolatus TaxID=592308 RepID=A0A212U547_9MICO|nr:FAD-dependent oxidoreductase [Kytococcus aerolatus]SNC73316.1 Predicted flavoprotein CzcO associated with the cation diffusion facilitator CzcD [Kytococcus aerolatus]
MTAHAVAIIGAGFQGLTVADALLRRGIRDVVLLDERGEAGGCWLDRRDPGARTRASVSESTLPHRPRLEGEAGPSAHAMRQYLRRLASFSGATERLVPARVVAADQGADHVWTLRLADGGTVRARQLVLATGSDGDPVVPDLRGVDSFGGELAHTHLWDAGLETAGRHVVVLGEPGARGGIDHVNLAAALADEAASVTVFAPDHPWILPEVPAGESVDAVDVLGANRRVQRTGAIARTMGRVVREATRPDDQPAGAPEPPPAGRPARWQRAMAASAHLAARDLPRELWEDHLSSLPLHAGTVRSEEWFRAAGEGRVRLLRWGVHRVRPDAVVDVHGTRHRADLLVLTTGTAPLPPGAGIQGLDAADGGRLAGWAPHLGTLGQVPNLHVVGGPASDLPVGGDAVVAAARAGLVAQLVQATESAGAAAVVASPDAFDRWEHTVHRLQRATGAARDVHAPMWSGRRRDLVRLLRGRPGDFLLR